MDALLQKYERQRRREMWAVLNALRCSRHQSKNNTVPIGECPDCFERRVHIAFGWNWCLHCDQGQVRRLWRPLLGRAAPAKVERDPILGLGETRVLVRRGMARTQGGEAVMWAGIALAILHVIWLCVEGWWRWRRSIHEEGDQ